MPPDSWPWPDPCDCIFVGQEPRLSDGDSRTGNRSDLAREPLEEIDSPCLGTSEISTRGGDGKLGWVSFAPLDDPHHPLRRIAPFAFGLSRRTARPSRQKLGKLNPDRLAVRAFAGEVLRTQVRPDFP